MVKVITKGGKIILGQLQYITDSSIHVMPGTNKESRKGRYYERVEIPYSDIISIRYREFNWIGLVLGLAGMVVIYLMATGVIPILIMAWVMEMLLSGFHHCFLCIAFFRFLNERDTLLMATRNGLQNIKCGMKKRADESKRSTTLIQ